MGLTLQRSFAAGLSAIAATAAFALEPVQNINPQRHGNLAAAQDLVREAFDKLSDAQRANHGMLGGHAARAKDLMLQAAEEIKLAAITANGGVASTEPVYVAPPGVAYVAPTEPVPGPGYSWAWHPGYGWDWHHPYWGWRAGWR